MVTYEIHKHGEENGTATEELRGAELGQLPSVEPEHKGSRQLDDEPKCHGGANGSVIVYHSFLSFLGRVELDGRGVCRVAHAADHASENPDTVDKLGKTVSPQWSKVSHDDHLHRQCPTGSSIASPPPRYSTRGKR